LQNGPRGGASTERLSAGKSRSLECGPPKTKPKTARGGTTGDGLFDNLDPRLKFREVKILGRIKRTFWEGVVQHHVNCLCGRPKYTKEKAVERQHKGNNETVQTRQTNVIKI